MHIPTLHEAMMAYYRGELGGFEPEYLKMLYEVVLKKHSEYETQVVQRHITDKDFLADVSLYGRIKAEINRIIQLKSTKNAEELSGVA